MMDETAYTLVSHVLCPYVQRAAILLHEKSVPFERIWIDLGDKPDWLRAISPLGKVPVLLLADGRPLFESAPICEFIDETTEGPRMLPGDAVERARHRAWIAYASATLDAVAAYYTAGEGAAFEEAGRRLRGRFEELDRALEKGPFFAGEAFGQVDAAFAPLMRYFDVFDRIVDHGVFDGLPAVQAYRTALAGRTSVREAAVDDYPARLLAFVRNRAGALAQRARTTA